MGRTNKKARSTSRKPTGIKKGSTANKQASAHNPKLQQSILESRERAKKLVNKNTTKACKQWMQRLFEYTSDIEGKPVNKTFFKSLSDSDLDQYLCAFFNDCNKVVNFVNCF